MRSSLILPPLLKLRDKTILRQPDIIIGSEYDPYLIRWHLIRQRYFCNAYLHYFLRSDDDRSLHDHPFANLSILLEGSYLEHTILAGGVHVKTLRQAGDIVLRPSGKMAHRIELIDGPCWTLFLTGPRYRNWGFHCAKGWIYWEDFVSVTENGNHIGAGCDGPTYQSKLDQSATKR